MSTTAAPGAAAGNTVARREDAQRKVVTEQLVHAKTVLDRYADDLSAIMPAHANRAVFMGLAAAAVRRDDKLRQAVMANPASFVMALRECAYLGHVPKRGIFDLVAFNDKSATGGMSVTGMEEYRGTIERMYRAGGVKAVKVNVGRAGDRVLRFNPTIMDLPQHEYDEFAPPSERGPLKVAYAWAVMPGGTVSAVAWLPLHEIARRRAKSKSGETFWGPAWPDEGPNTESMWRKSALHALEPLVPTSSEYRAEIARAELVAAERFPDMPAPTLPAAGDSDWDAEVVG